MKYNGKTVTKAGQKVNEQGEVILEQEGSFVGRGANKLAHAIEVFDVEVAGKTCADVGASTGGFTDYLLQNGASKVYAIENGSGQLDPKLAADSRVVNLEKTDIRELGADSGIVVDLAVVDLSFVSLKLVIENIVSLVRSRGQVIALLKPQFECGPGVTNKAGVILDSQIREKVVSDLVEWFRDSGYEVSDAIESPVLGKKGNVEYFVKIICD